MDPLSAQQSVISPNTQMRRNEFTMKNILRRLCAALVVVVMLLPLLAVSVQAATYIWPLDSDNNYITSYAGNRIHPLTGERQNHSGIDIRAGKGESVYATASGRAYIGCNWCSHNYGKSKSCGCGGGYGNYVYIVHDTGMVSYYAHLTKVKIEDGQYVSQGKVIGTVGSTGSSTGYHLHFEMRTSTSRDDRKDPLNYVSIPGEDDDIVIPEESTSSSSGSSSSSTFNPNVVEYYTGLYSGNKNNSNVYDDTSAPSVSVPEESKSDITISMTAYPKALDKGDSCNLKGTVKATGKLTSVKGRILKADGSTVQNTIALTSSTSLNINKSDINKNLLFGRLPEGSYILSIEATAADGSTASWKQSFTVGNVQSAPSTGSGNSSSGSTSTDTVVDTGDAKVSGSVEIDLTNYPTTLKRGSSCSLRGTISSSARVEVIRGYILDANGNEVQSTKDSVSAKSVNVKSANVNKKLAFGKLAAGSYTLKIVAIDKDGGIGTWEKGFIVK